jgi:Mn2+/Fe2+ NRAMP family transporter
VLQEAAGRITVLTGHELGTAIRRRYGGPARVNWVATLLTAGVVLGCAAYQAGNLLGAVAGMRLVADLSPALLTAVCGAGAAALLATGSTRWIANILGGLVAVMGVAFLVTAVRLAPDAGALLAGLLVPRIPSGSTVLVLGLVGTTVVPYNLFLGSALARGSRLGEMRWGLVLAVGGGGLISLGILVVGTALGGGLEYERLAAVLGTRLGSGAEWSLAVGLFAAGFSSAITAPLAAAITVRTLVGGAERPQWSESGVRFRAVWLGVLLFGAGFGIAGVQPIPVIILAQAFNGLLLPLVAVFLWLTMNDRGLLGDRGVNTLPQNLLMGVVVVACVVLGLRGLAAAAGGILSMLSG